MVWAVAREEIFLTWGSLPFLVDDERFLPLLSNVFKTHDQFVKNEYCHTCSPFKAIAAAWALMSQVYSIKIDRSKVSNQSHPI